MSGDYSNSKKQIINRLIKQSM
jgi:hypothetical protein